MDLSNLSVAEIRQRLTRDGASVSPALLRKLLRDPREGVRRLHEVFSRRWQEQKRRRVRLDALLHFERVLWRSGVRRIAGVDEAGVGPLAGPVVAAAVVFPPDVEIEDVDDSKRLDAPTRARLAEEIRAKAAVGVGLAEVEEIDRLNIYRAALVAMRRAVLALPQAPEHVLVDARQIPELAIPQNPFCKGDGINFSIAAASIIAKTHRDALMERLDREHPEYGFARHKGYGTRSHQEAIRRHGPSPVHRMSFAVIHELCGEYSGRFYELRLQIEGLGTSEELAGFEKELAARREELAEEEQRKLRLILNRRWAKEARSRSISPP